jgi:hypothetical protein
LLGAESPTAEYLAEIIADTLVRLHAMRSLPAVSTACGRNSYAYDAAGNMLTGAGRTMTWDGQNRIATVTTATTAYAFAPDGDRIRTVVTPTSTYILGSTEIDASGTYIKVPNPDVRIIGATACFVHRDQLASILFETNGAGAIALRQRYQRRCA